MSPSFTGTTSPPFTCVAFFSIVKSVVSTSSGSVGVGSSLSPTNATLVIAPSILVTSIENSTVTVDSAGTLISLIPAIKSSAVFVSSITVSPTLITTFPCISALFSNIVAKSASFTVVIPSTVPVFCTEIVYVITSPTLAVSTVSPSLVMTLVLSALIIDVSVGFPSLLSSPLAIATFEMVPVASSLTLTENSTVFVPFASTSTNHLKDVTFSSASLNVSAFSVLDTYVVPSGMASVTKILSIFSVVLFCTVMVYKIVSPGCTSALPDCVTAVFVTVILGVCTFSMFV